MKHVLFNLLVGVSLLLMAATVIFWVQSHRTIRAISYSIPRHVGQDVIDRSYGIYDETGKIGLYRSEYTYGDVTANELALLLEHRRWLHFSVLASEVATDTADARFFHGWTDWRFYGLSVYDYLSGGEEKNIIELPFAAILLVLSIAPVWKATSVVRGRKRRRDRLCLKCGYDLRATPERCPECGLAPAKSEIVPQ